MPRRIIFKDNGIRGQLAKEGYKIIGFEDGAFTEVGTSSVTKIIDETPKVFLLTRNKYLYRGGPVPNGFDDLTGKDLPKFLPGNQTGFFKNDYDLSSGNYSQIIVNMAYSNSLKLPNTELGKNLAQLWLQGGRLGTQSCEVDFTKYPNLGWVLIAGNQGHVRSFSNLEDYENDWKPNYLITSSEINLPYCGVMHLGLLDDTLWTRFSNSQLKLYVYSDSRISLSSIDLQQVNLDFSGFTWSSAGNFYSEENDRFPQFSHYLQLSSCINLTDINIENLPQLENNPDSSVFLNFTNNNLTQASVDGILQAIDEAYSINMTSGVLSLGRTNNGDEPTLSNDFVVGQKYVIKELQSGDDFSNVGYVSDGVEFTSTDTTPTNWSNGTTVYFGSSFGTGKGFTMSYLDGDIQDGVYILPDLSGKGSYTKAEIISNIITRSEFLGSAGYDGTQYVGSTINLTGNYFTKIDEFGRTIWQGSPTASMTLEITEIAKNSAPTGGENNSNYISLKAKGWNVFISVS
jgi:hypothetical protein